MCEHYRRTAVIGDLLFVRRVLGAVFDCCGWLNRRLVLHSVHPPLYLTLYVRMAIITTGVNAITVSVQDFVDLVEPQK